MPDVKFPTGLIVSGDHPLVIIGPNGVGKTRLGVILAQNSNGERIAALRNVEIPAIPMQRFSQASQEVKSALSQLISAHWRQSYELQNLLSEILAEDREKAVEYREQALAGVTPIDNGLVKTRLRKIIDVWNKHFPNRTIKIDYEPIVERTVGSSTSKYPIAQMSEGERTALYLAARVVSCTNPILVVDEPESYFHPLLARRFWDDLEELAKNVRFIYITHDIPFALSRKHAQFAVAKSEKQADLLPPASSLPPDLIAHIFGAASFSVTASRLVFVEGNSSSYDVDILSAWHCCPQTVVVPAGGCGAVRECVRVFRAGLVTGGFDAVGYVDRDGLPDNILEGTPGVKAHSVSEIEGIICLEPIFKAIAKYTDIDGHDAEKRYNTFIAEGKALFKDVLLNKEILNRAKKHADVVLAALMNPIKPDPDLATVRAAFEGAMPVGGWQATLSNMFDEEEKRLRASLAGAPNAFLRDFPAKGYFNIAAKHLDMSPDAIVRLICQALKLSDGEAVENKKLAALRDSLVHVLSPSMWPRTV